MVEAGRVEEKLGTLIGRIGSYFPGWNRYGRWASTSAG